MVLCSWDFPLLIATEYLRYPGIVHSAGIIAAEVVLPVAMAVGNYSGAAVIWAKPTPPPADALPPRMPKLHEELAAATASSSASLAVPGAASPAQRYALAIDGHRTEVSVSAMQ